MAMDTFIVLAASYDTLGRRKPTITRCATPISRPACWTPTTPSLTASLVRGRIPGAEPAYFQDLYAERLEPREQTLQGCLISKLPMYNGLYRLHRGAETVEIKQSLGRENTG